VRLLIVSGLLDEPDEFELPEDAGFVGAAVGGGLFWDDGCDGVFALFDCEGVFVGGAATPLLACVEVAPVCDPGALPGADSVAATEESVHALINKPMIKIVTTIVFLFIFYLSIYISDFNL
jgi:hypothetical protein